MINSEYTGLCACRNIHFLIYHSVIIIIDLVTVYSSLSLIIACISHITQGCFKKWGSLLGAQHKFLSTCLCLTNRFKSEILSFEDKSFLVLVLR